MTRIEDGRLDFVLALEKKTEKEWVFLTFFMSLFFCESDIERH